ncbi:MAG TPA: HAD-IA family hydrolase [Bacteroidota bacterium]|nr:HAD-IA family hydrolase [Bacteroidota bacterium]
MSKITTVIFDMGRVLVDIDFDAFPRLLGIDKKRINRADEEAVQDMAREYETGRIGTDHFFKELDRIFKGKYSRQELETAWNAIIVKENSAIVPLVDAVRTRYQIAVLSNTSSTHFRRSCDVAPVLQKFSKKYLSYQLGAAKPDPAVYRHAIRDLSADPASLLFIDDVVENINAAVQCGMNGIVFTGVASLNTALILQHVL